MIPGEPDCDGEVFNEEEIRKFRESYHEYGGIIDEEHTYLQNKKSTGEPVEDYLLPGPTTMKNIHGEERIYPPGTWVVKSKITDPEMMIKAEKGEVAYSPTTITRQRAEALAAQKGRTLMREVPDGVVYTLSLTTRPCIDNSCQVGKSDPAVKYGVSISKQNKSILEKARDIIDSLISPKEPENRGDNVTKSEEDKKNDEYVTKSDLEEFGNDLVEKFKEATKEPPQAIKCTECKHELAESDKFCPECGDEISTEKEKKSEKSKSDEDEDKGKSKAIKNHDDGKNETAFKSIEHYAGRDLKGRPLKEEKK